MKKCLLFTLLFAITIPISIFGQGSLTPPAGTPAPTMKSLDQIEPRTPISSLPFTVTSPGSYYLTKNLTATGSGAGISVSVDNVTIDLNGFTLSGGGTGSTGILVSANLVTIRNGNITGWTVGGVEASSTSTSLFEKLLIYSNNGSGESPGLAAGNTSVIRACAVYNTQNGAGIKAFNGCTVVDCICNNSGGNMASHGGFVLNNNGTIVNCTAQGNIGDGIQVGAYCSVIHCTATANTSNASNFGFGIGTSFGCTVADCTVASNGNNGISVDSGSTVRGCTARFNSNSGIVASSNCYLIGNTCDSNNRNNASGNSGIYTYDPGNTIDSNSCTSNGNGAGIVSLATHNIIIRNSCSANTGGNYNVLGTSSGNAVGPVVDMTAGGTISNTNPWTNWIH